MNDQFYLRAARWIATLTAGLMIGGAMLFTVIDMESMNDVIWIASVFGGVVVSAGSRKILTQFLAFPTNPARSREANSPLGWKPAF